MSFETELKSALAAELALLQREVARRSSEIEALRKALPPAWVPVREAALAMGVSEVTLRRRIKEGKLPVQRIGRAVRVDLAALRAPDPAVVVRLASIARSG